MSSFHHESGETFLQTYPLHHLQKTAKDSAQEYFPGVLQLKQGVLLKWSQREQDILNVDEGTQQVLQIANHQFHMFLDWTEDLRAIRDQRFCDI